MKQPTASSSSSSSTPQTSSSSFGPSSSSSTSHSQPSSNPSSNTTSQSNPNSSSSNPTSNSHSSGSQSIASTRPMAESDYQEEILENQQAEGWGSLNPINPNKYHAFNLTGDNEIIFGRMPGLSYVFNKDRHSLSDQEYLNISKQHFMIKKLADNSVELTDLSSNGTYVNRHLVGKGRRYPLTHLARIAMGLPEMEVFVFLNNSEKELEDERMPVGFKQKYSLENVILGEGAAGCVKKCFVKARPEEKYAVKILKKGRSFSSTSKDFSYESSILASVSHENIVKVIDCFENEHCFYMVMEYVEGGELFDYVKNKGAVTEKKGSEFFLQLLKGVAYLHDNGITHRDLKPENILLDDRDHPSILKITDFGLSRFVSETSLMETLVGTPTYLAPEILNPGVKGYTKKVDSWSLGCILFILLGGYPPFSQENPDLDLQEAILTGSFCFHEERWGSISDSAKDLVKGLLTVEVENRLSVQDALKHPFVQEVEAEQAAPAKKRKTKE